MSSNIHCRPSRSRGLAQVALRMLNLEAPLPREGGAQSADLALLAPSPLLRRVVDPLLPLEDAAATVRERGAPVGHEAQEAARDLHAVEPMLQAVISRLKLTVDERYLPTHDASSREHSNRLRHSVLECVGALERINQTLLQELRPPQPGRRRAT